MSKYLVEIDALNLYVGTTKLTENLSLKIEEGDRIGITGPSGCGKSTLLKTIISKDFPKETNFRKFEIEKKCLFSYMPQSNGLLPWFSVRKNFEIFSKDTELFNQTIEEFGLGQNLDSFPHQLSGGEYQRAILASAIINKPKVFLADEPLTELDITKKWKLLAYWSEKIKEFNSSLILVSHDLETLLYLCDRVNVFSDKPSQIKKEIFVNSSHPRKKEFLLSEQFINARTDLLTLI